MRALMVLAAFLFLMTQPGACPASSEMRIDWFSINCGGGRVAGSDQVLDFSVGQSVAGHIRNEDYLHWVGFWFAEVLQSAAPGTISAAKTYADGVEVSMSGKIATSCNEDFQGFFYIQEPSRSSGIRVVCPIWPVRDLIRGSTVTVTGTLRTTPAGERYISASIVSVGTQAKVPLPLGMGHKAVGGVDAGNPPFGQFGAIGSVGPNNIGLLITTWGNVTKSEPGYLTINDGSETGLRVDTSGLSKVPTSGYITVTGISSLYTGRSPLILPRDDLDIH